MQGMGEEGLDLGLLTLGHVLDREAEQNELTASRQHMPAVVSIMCKVTPLMTSRASWAAAAVPSKRMADADLGHLTPVHTSSRPCCCDDLTQLLHRAMHSTLLSATSSTAHAPSTVLQRT